MANSSVITLKLNTIVNGERQLQQMTVEMRELAKVAKLAQSELGQPIDLAAMTYSLGQVQNMIGGALSTLKSWQAAYSVQETAETKLATAMRNTMGASEGEIQSIKDLCSAQQELGVIGDEVQLAGAQELATYLTMTDSLKTLIPVMNDMVAQQYGLEASGESAAQIATMLGKVMNGQVNALSRYGYTFTEAQEQILKFGTESQRAAVLADVVGQSVGGMNAALAQTDSGKQKQLENTLGDIVEELGKITEGAMPFLTLAANTTTALMGVMKFVTGVRAAVTAVTTFRWAQHGAAVASLILAGNTSKTTQIMRLFTSGLHSGTAATVALRIAIRGLLISTGVGIAIWALTEAINYLCNASDKASQKLKEVTEAEKLLAEQKKEANKVSEADAQHMRDEKIALDSYISRLKTFNGSKAEEKKIVAELNGKYGETMGYFKTVAEWYNALATNSETYCQQMQKEARIRQIVDQMQQNSIAMNAFVYDEQGNIKHYSTKKKRNGKSDLEEAQLNYNKLRAQNRDLQKEMDATRAELSNLTFSVKGTATMPDFTDLHTPSQPSLTDEQKAAAIDVEQVMQRSRDVAEDFSKALEELRLKQRFVNREEYAAIAENIKQIEAERDAFTGVQKTLTGREKAAAIDVTEILSRDLDSIADYDEAISDLTEKQKYAAADYYAQLQGYIDVLEQERKEFAETKPLAIDKLNTIKDLQKAISYYQAIQQEQSADEYTATQRTIDALERKRAAIERGTELISMQREVDEIQKLPENEIRVKISGMGFDELTGKIRELKKMLADLDNPVTTNQRKDIMLLISTYEEWRRAGVQSFATFKDGWGNVKGIGSGVKSLSDALSGNASVWERLTGVVDGFISIYEGINSIIKIIDMLSLSQKAETTATMESATAKGVNAMMAQNASGALATMSAQSLAAAGASKAEASADLLAASAKTFKAHAWIPWVGIGIAAAGVAAMLATMGGLPKFADGGIAYGPTLGLFGEYAGARSNPEVVAPLSKLKDMVGTRQEYPTKLKLVAEGGALYGVLTDYQRRIQR